MIKKGAWILFTLPHCIYRDAVLLLRGEEIPTKHLYPAEILDIQGQNQIWIKHCYTICKNGFRGLCAWLLLRKRLSSTVLNLQRSMFSPYFPKGPHYFPLRCHLHTASHKTLVSLKHRHWCCLCPWVTVHCLENCSWQPLIYCSLFQWLQAIVCATSCNVGWEMQLLLKLLLWGFHTLEKKIRLLISAIIFILHIVKAAHTHIHCLWLMRLLRISEFKGKQLLSTWGTTDNTEMRRQVLKDDAEARAVCTMLRLCALFTYPVVISFSLTCSMWTLTHKWSCRKMYFLKKPFGYPL